MLSRLRKNLTVTILRNFQSQVGHWDFGLGIGSETGLETVDDKNNFRKREGLRK